MNTPEKLGTLLQQAGLVCEKVWSERFAHAWTLEALMTVHAACSVSARRLASVPEFARVECQQRVRTRLARFGVEELTYRPTVVFAVAHRPA